MSQKAFNNNLIDIEVQRDHEAIAYSVTRKVLRQNELEEISGYDRQKESPVKSVTNSLRNVKCGSLLYDLCPVLKWLPEYKIHKNLMCDVISGITVAIMHIPQGMAYGLLAGVEPIVGLYMAFFPTLIYFLFGTSRHISMGTFAVVSLMTSKIVATYSDPNHDLPIATNLTTSVVDDGTYSYTPFQVATAVTMMTGLYQLVMCVLRLGALSSLLSEALVNGFTTAAAVHVMVSQLKDLLGIKIPRHKGAFKIILSLRDIALNIPNVNLNAVYVSIAGIIFMVAMNEFLKPWAAKRCKFPIPSELMAVCGFTAASYFMMLGTDYGVKEVGKIPIGLPVPEMPPLELLRLVAVDSIAVTIVSYSIVMSMALIFARKEQYEVRANQELLAMGLSNIFGSFFSCIPLACSLSRSLIQHQTGGKTQVASVVSAGLILIVLLWIGPLFETLPRATLAAIIIVALKGMIMQVKDLKRFSREGTLEMAVWITTFVSVIIIDIDIGLLAGILVSLLALYIKGWKSYSCLYGQVPGTDIYIDLKTHQKVAQVSNIKIFHYCGSINFASRASFKKDLFSAIQIDHRIIRRASLCESIGEGRGLGLDMRSLIIDLTAVAHLDSAGCKTLSEIKNEMKVLDVKLFLAGASDRVYDSLVRASQLGEPSFECFATVHDAVLYAQGKPTELKEL